MKVALFDRGIRTPGIGFIDDSDIIDVTEWVGPPSDSPLGAFLTRRARETPPLDGQRLPLTEVKLLPPARGTGAIICVGVNYAEHGRRVAELSGAKFDPGAPPSLFMKMWRSLTGPDQDVVRPAAADWLDFEGELVVVIGRHCRAVPRERALEVVGGYSVGNDGSVRDWQRKLPTLTAGKNFFRTGSLGPWVVTADEIPDPSVLRVTTTLNGEVMQDAPVSDMMNDVPALIEHISTFTPLAPGDVIFTGTPGGSFSDRGNKRWLVAGDEIAVTIPEIGTLRNRVVDENHAGMVRSAASYVDWHFE
ncbi:fumarylacetoacetate hydrolase family protein [Nocardia sp. NPDC055053]